MQKQVQYIIKGMNRDMSISKYPSDHSYENKNIRITQREDDTLLSVTNEKGPSEVVLTQTIEGTIIGHCVIREYIVLFVKKMSGQTPSYSIFTNTIYRITPETGLVVKLVECTDNYYPGGANSFDKYSLLFGNSIQAFGVYESDDVIKVYWVDNRNQNRFINIVNPKKIVNGVSSYIANDTNFVPIQSFPESVDIHKVTSSNGIFAPGALQYIMTYYNRYGQESAFFYYSDLYYTSHVDRGGKEDENVSNAFQITITDSDTQFDYVRIYSILRTSIDGAPQCRIVADVKTSADPITVVDNGTIGENFDYQALLFMCGDVVASRTVATKDDTMFNGNLSLLVPRIPADIKQYIRDSVVVPNHQTSSTDTDITITFNTDTNKPYSLGELSSSYPYNIHLDLSQRQISTFKYREKYRFGLQFLHKTGKWSDVVFLADVENDVPIPTALDSFTETVNLISAEVKFEAGSNFDWRWFSDNGFIKMRPVIVYPEVWDRNILAQGIVCPTVYNLEDRVSNRPYAYSSWFCRPNAGAQPKTTSLGSKTGNYNEFRHNKPIPKNTEINAEIMCIQDAISPFVASATTPDERDSLVQDHKEQFFIDKSVVTLHSPELEMGTDLDNMDLTGVKFRIVGIAPLTGFSSDLYLSTSTLGNFTHNVHFNDASDGDATGQATLGPGFYDETVEVQNISPDGWKSRMGNINWIDEETHYKEKHADDGHVYIKAPKWYGFFIYPWHRSKSLNNTVSPDENGWESALLENKIITNSRYSYSSYFFPNNYAWTPDISGVKIANIEPQSEESSVSLVKLPEPENSDLGELNYYGSVDKIVVPSNNNNKSLGYPIIIAASSRLTGDSVLSVTGTNYEGIATHGTRALTNHELFTGKYDQASLLTDRQAISGAHPEGTLMEYIPYGFTCKHGADSDTWSTYVNATDHNARRKYWQVSTFDAVRLRYKSTKHAVMAFNYTSDHRQVVLPKFSSEELEGYWESGKKYYWEVGKSTVATGVYQESLSAANVGGANSQYGYLYIGELYRDDVQNRFGGDSEDAFEKNTWLPGGDAVAIPGALGTETMTVDRGDTYYQRYDCIKTYPFTPDEKNSIIETVSFMCETHINIDGRYDKNRGNTSKFTLTPKNFNLMNPVYSQQNNFFNYQYLNDSRIYPEHFNQIAWTQTKSAMNEIDTWTKLNLASIMDMDGDKGEIVALVYFNNDIWCFQERGISKILFNNRVQIPVSDGVPIEITNGMKVQGKVYLTDKAGCQNKFAITVTPHGVYFIDGYNSNICIFDGKSIQNVSDIKGFKEWISKQDGVTEWYRESYAERVDGFRVEYDSDNQDVYFINDDHCLVFSEMLAEFTSFIDYNKVRGMGNVKDNFYSVTDFDGDVKVWKMFGGDYNVFFKPADEDEWESYYKPFYIQYNVNPEPTFDKTFDNVEFRSDSWDGNNLVTAIESAGSNKTFDTLEVENEYQYGSLALDFSHAKYSQDSTLKRKFRVWRTIMPREVGTRNRIRNTWCKVKLAWNNPNRYKTVLHDTIIKYFV